MVGGQVVDVQSEDSGDITKEKLDFIYRLKTGALIESSMLIGAVLAGATKNEQNTIAEMRRTTRQPMCPSKGLRRQRKMLHCIQTAQWQEWIRWW